MVRLGAEKRGVLAIDRTDFSPLDLIGLPYRLGSKPLEHDSADCLSLARTVLASYGIPSPEPKREWYRRLRRSDYGVFREELSAWGVRCGDVKVGAVGLCRADLGFGLAVYYEHGWLSFVESVVRWSPIGSLEVVEVYCCRTNTT